MKFFLTIAILWALALFSWGASAASVTCKYSDRGWEEHWGGHKSCQECLAKHGRCIETCQINFYTCEAQGKDTLGKPVSFKGYGESQYEASQNARIFCERHLRNCSYSTSCSSKSETLSSRECPKN